MVAGKLCDWNEQLKRHWHEFHWGSLVVKSEKAGWIFDAQMSLGEVPPESIELQVYADPIRQGDPVCELMHRRSDIPGTLNGYHYRCHISSSRPYTDFTPRVVAYHVDARTPAENSHVL